MAGEASTTAPSVRRRLAAILAADVAGYSRLMAADEAATLAALDDARATFRLGIDAHGGRLIDMSGDSVLAVFESATAAVSAALAVQRELALAGEDVEDDQRMQFRIGVHLGDVMEKDDGTVYGDGVNTAARLEGLAEPGRVAVSSAVYAAVRGRLVARFDDLGSHRVKNIAEPVHAYRASEETRGLASRSATPGAVPAAGLGLKVRSSAGRRRADTRRVLPTLFIEVVFALLPLLVLGANWPDDAAARPHSFGASPAWAMTACFLYGLSLARLLPAFHADGAKRPRSEGTAVLMVTLLPLAGVIASVVLVARLSALHVGDATLIVTYLNLFLALICFAVFGGYGLRGSDTAREGNPP